MLKEATRLWPSHLPDGQIIALDCETSGLFPDDGHRISTVSIGWFESNEYGRQIEHSIALPFNQGARDTDQGVLQLEEDPNLDEATWYAMLDWLSRQWLVFHNAKFDLHMFRVGTDDWPGRDLSDRLLWCTMIAASAIEPRDEVALKAISEKLQLTNGQERIFEERVKQWVASSKKTLKKVGLIRSGDSKNPRYDLMPWEIMEGYAIQDTRLTILLYHWQQTWLAQDELGEYPHHDLSAGYSTDTRAVIERRMEVCRALYDLEKHGIGWNYEKAEEIAGFCERAVKRLDMEMLELGIRKITSGGVLQYLADKGIWQTTALEGARYTDGGAHSLDAQEVDRLIGHFSGAPEGSKEELFFNVVRMWKERHLLDTAANMWFRGYTEKMGRDGRLRATYRQLKTVTGRMSVERINLQAQPRNGIYVPDFGFAEVKKLIIPAIGYRLWNMDLSQAELRVGAKVANCRKMIEPLEEGRDFHGVNATSLFGGKVTERFCVLADVPLGTWTPRSADDASNDNELAVWKTARQVGKTVTFSCLFRGGPAALQRALGMQARIYITTGEAGQWVDAWRSEYKEIVRAWYKFEKQATRHGWVVLGGGDIEERSWLWGGTGRRTAEDYQGFNRIVQGGIALLNQEWMARAGTVLRENAYAGRLVLNVHDSLMVETTERAKMNAGVPLIISHLAKLGEDLGRNMFSTKITVDVNEWGK